MIESETDDALNIFGYSMFNEKGEAIGKVDDIDTSTMNTLIISGDNLIPLAAIEILDINHKLHTISIKLPEGLLDINR